MCSVPNSTASGLACLRRRLCSTVTYATENLDRGVRTSLITADTSKAFDSVEHGRLLDKLGWYGIETGWLAGWLAS